MNITQEARQRINEIAARNDGKLTAEQVYEDAKDPDSPLHGYFTWDLLAAARAHGLDVARRLIRGVLVVYKEERSTIRAPAYVRDPEMASDRQGYVSIARLRNDEDLSRAALVNEFSRAAGALRRAREIAAALSMKEQMQSMLEQIELWSLQARRDTDAHS